MIPALRMPAQNSTLALILAGECINADTMIHVIAIHVKTTNFAPTSATVRIYVKTSIPVKTTLVFLWGLATTASIEVLATLNAY
jgi:hypothetical protein